MHIGVLLGVEPHHRIGDFPRLMGGGRIVEIHERLAVDRLSQEREALPIRGDVERR